MHPTMLRGSGSLVLLVALAGALVAAPLAPTHGFGHDAMKQKLAALETELKHREAALLATGPAFRAAYGRVAAVPMSAEQARQAGRGEMGALPAPLKSAIESGRAAVTVHQANLEAYFDAYDRASSIRMDLKVLDVVQDLGRAREELAPRVGAAHIRPLDKALNQVKVDVEEYWANRETQEGRDSYKRLFALRRLSDSTRAAEKGVSKLRRRLGDEPRIPLHQRMMQAGARAKRMWMNLRTKTALLPPMSKILAYLANPWRKDDPERVSTLIREMGTRFSTAAKVDLEVHGRENLPTDARVIVTPSHRSDFVDTMGMTSILKGSVTPIQTVLFYPKWLRPAITSMMKDEPGLILAQAEGIDVVKRCVESLKAGRTLLFFPEGNIPSPLGEIRRLRTGLESITDALLDEKVRVVPVSLDDPADGWGEAPFASGDAAVGMKVRVVFDKPIDPRAVHAMGHGTQRLLLNMLRETYHLNLLPQLHPTGSREVFHGEMTEPAEAAQ